MADKAELYGAVGVTEGANTDTEYDKALLFGVFGATSGANTFAELDKALLFGVYGVSNLANTDVPLGHAYLYGMFSVGEFQALVYPDRIPEMADLTQVQGTQSLTGADAGKSVITVSWTAPTNDSRVGAEWIGTSTGAADVFNAAYANMASDEEVYEVTGYSGGDTTLASVATHHDNHIHVTSATGFSADDWVEVKEEDIRTYAQVLSVNGSILYLKQLLELSFTTSATVKEVTVSLKTVTTDYTINRVSGQVTAVSGHFTSGNQVAIRYSPALSSSIARFELYRLPGNLSLPSGCLKSDLLAQIGVVTVNSNISSGASSYEDTLTSDENGEDWSYYLFTVDSASTPQTSRGAGANLETITTVPLNVSKRVGDSTVYLSWDVVTDPNFNGFNVFRCTGTWDASTAVKVNSILVTGESFEDGPWNITNRRSSGEVPYPANGSTYSYKIESQDTATTWSTGTVNQSQGVSENLTASKSV